MGCNQAKELEGEKQRYSIELLQIISSAWEGSFG
jgi:hypothetical protein